MQHLPTRRWAVLIGIASVVWCGLLTILYILSHSKLHIDRLPYLVSVPHDYAYLFKILKGIGAAGICSVMATGVGHLALRRLSFYSRAEKTEKLLFSTIIGMSIFSWLTLGLGLLGLWSRELFGGITILWSIVVIAKVKLRNFRLSTILPTQGIFSIVAILLLGFIFLFMFVGALTPEIFYDSLHYHLGVLNFFQMAHRVYSLPTLIHSNFVLLPQFFYGWVLTVGNELSVKLVHVWMGALLALSLISFGRRLLSARAGLLGALIFFSTPMVTINMMTAGIDIASTLFAFAGVYAVWLALTENWSALGILFAGVLTGLSASCKPTQIPMSALLAVLYASFVFQRSSKVLARQKVAIFFVGMVTAMSPWLLKAIYEHGNPFYPFGAIYGWGRPFIHSTLWQNFLAGSRELPFLTSPWLDFLLLPWNLTMYGIRSADFVGLSYLFLLPWIFYQRKTSRIFKFLAAYTFILIALWLTSHALPRFFLLALVLLSLLLADSFDRWTRQNGRAALVTLAFIPVLIGVFQSLERFYLKDGWNVLLGRTTEESYLSASHVSYPSPSYAGILWMNRHLPKGSKILFMGDARTYPTKHDLVSSYVHDPQPLIEWSKQATDVETLAERVRSQGITHLFLNVRRWDTYASSPAFQWDLESWSIFDRYWSLYGEGLSTYASPSGDVILKVFRIRDTPRASPDHSTRTPNPFLAWAPKA